MNNPKIIFHVHAVQRMFERRVSIKKVLGVIQTWETIEDYSSETPEPSRLILGFQGKRSFLMVTSKNPETSKTTIVAVDFPEPDKWRKDFRSQR